MSRDVPPRASPGRPAAIRLGTSPGRFAGAAHDAALCSRTITTITAIEEKIAAPYQRHVDSQPSRRTVISKAHVVQLTDLGPARASRFPVKSGNPVATPAIGAYTAGRFFDADADELFAKRLVLGNDGSSGAEVFPVGRRLEISGSLPTRMIPGCRSRLTRWYSV